MAILTDKEVKAVEWAVKMLRVVYGRTLPAHVQIEIEALEGMVEGHKEQQIAKIDIIAHLRPSARKGFKQLDLELP